MSDLGVKEQVLGNRTCLLLAKGTVSLGRSTLNIAGRNVSSSILLHAIPDGRTTRWRQPYRPKESSLRTMAAFRDDDDVSPWQGSAG